MSINSDYCKAALFSYLRFTGKSYLFASECGHYNSDILAVQKNKLIEYEIKISKTDFKNDFKKEKHEKFEMSIEQLQYTLTKMTENNASSYEIKSIKTDFIYIPNQFYFTVPTELVPFAKGYLEAENSKYGLIEIRGRSYPWIQKPIVVIKAQDLHDRPVQKIVQKTILSRMGSELANFGQKNLR